MVTARVLMSILILEIEFGLAMDGLVQESHFATAVVVLRHGRRLLLLFGFGRLGELIGEAVPAIKLDVLPLYFQLHA